MNHDVPQPMTATFAPGGGSTSCSAGASSAARAHSSGWLRISSIVTLISARI